MGTTGDGKKLCKRPFQPEIDEEPQNEADRNNLSGVSDLNTRQRGNPAGISGISDLEEMMKQRTFTRFETQHLIALLHSRTIQESPSSDAILSSRVVDEQIASPVQLAHAYKGNTCGTGQALRQDSKTSIQPPSTMENLPDELLSNVFIRLSAKQLAQMRSVSQSWNGLLSQSSFIKSHLHRSIHNNDQILLVFHNDIGSSSDFKSFAAFPGRSTHLELTNFIKLPVNPRPEYTNDITLIGSVNGLICSCYGDSVIHIWNPSLSAVLTLPPYSTPSASGDYDTIKSYFRFGFDPKTDDYKVVKLTGLTEPNKYLIKWWLQVEVYSMRRGSWELITGRFPSHIIEIPGYDVACADGHDGHLHWLGYINEKSDSARIVAFDLGSETFHEIPVPESTLDHIHQNVLGVLAGKLCVMSWVYNGACEVWVMEEYGVTDSWVKHHVFSQFTGDTWPFGFTSHSELLLENNGYLVLYDPFANEQKILEEHSSEEYSLDKIVEYVDSLIWAAPTKHEMVDGAGQI